MVFEIISEYDMKKHSKSDREVNQYWFQFNWCAYEWETKGKNEIRTNSHQQTSAATHIPIWINDEQIKHTL